MWSSNTNISIKTLATAFPNCPHLISTTILFYKQSHCTSASHSKNSKIHYNLRELWHRRRTKSWPLYQKESLNVSTPQRVSTTNIDTYTNIINIHNIINIISYAKRVHHKNRRDLIWNWPGTELHYEGEAFSDTAICMDKTYGQRLLGSLITYSSMQTLFWLFIFRWSNYQTVNNTSIELVSLKTTVFFLVSDRCAQHMNMSKCYVMKQTNISLN